MSRIVVKSNFGRYRNNTQISIYLRWVDNNSMSGPDLVQGILDIIGINTPGAILDEDSPEA